MRRSRALALLAVATAAAGLTAVVMPAAATPSRSMPGGLRLVQVRHSLLGTHTWYHQTYGGVPVYHGWYAVHDLRTGTYADDGRLAITGLAHIAPAVTAARAVGAARAAGVTASRGTLMVQAGRPARLVWVVDGTRRQALVDATTGAVGKLVRTADYDRAGTRHVVTGQGKVFDPNPVVTLQNEQLKDQANSNAAVPASAYSVVPLPNLNGSGKLVGRWAKIDGARGGVVSNANEKFLYQRADGGFEQVMAYYAENKLQTRLHSLGFDDVNAEQQDIFVNTIADDNSFYSPSNDTITFGRGGVDDAEDIEVIWHESGHAIQDDQVPGFGSTEQAGAIGEGFGDYLAMTMSMGDSPNTTKTPFACIADWDSTAYSSGPTHCLRRTDTNKTTADIDGEVHDDGEIWSRALRDINLGLGRTDADKLILEAQFQFTPGITFKGAATKIYTTAQAMQTQLGLTDAQVAAVRQAFVARKILPAS